MRHGLQRLAELVLLVTVILIITILAQHATSKAVSTLKETGKTTLPDIPLLPRLDAPSGDLLTLEGNSLVFHPERLPQGVWTITIEETSPSGKQSLFTGDVASRGEQQARTLRMADLDLLAALFTITLTKRDTKEARRITYAYVNPPWLDSQSLTLPYLANLLHQLPPPVEDAFFASCRLKDAETSLRQALEASFTIFCGLGSKIFLSACTTATDPQKCLSCIDTTDMNVFPFFYMSLFAAGLPDQPPDGLSECIPRDTWDTFRFALTGTFIGNAQSCPPDDRFCTLGTSQESWKTLMRTTFTPARVRVSGDYACRMTEGYPQIITLPLTCDQRELIPLT